MHPPSQAGRRRRKPLLHLHRTPRRLPHAEGRDATTGGTIDQRPSSDPCIHLPRRATMVVPKDSHPATGCGPATSRASFCLPSITGPTQFRHNVLGSAKHFRQGHEMENQNSPPLINFSASSLDIEAIVASFADDARLSENLRSASVLIVPTDLGSEYEGPAFPISTRDVFRHLSHRSRRKGDSRSSCQRRRL